jgi:hypothetical protein
MAYFMMLIVGALFCNAVPHLVSGLRGEHFFTPWAQPRGIGKSSALQNFLWGAANMMVGLMILTHAGQDLPYRLELIVIGFLAAGIGLSITFGRRSAN